MTNLDEGTIDIARDAIRAGRVDEVAGIIGEQPKSKLLGELVSSLRALCEAGGVTYLAVHMNGGKSSCSVQCKSVDAFAADVAESGGKLTEGPQSYEGDQHRWRGFTAVIGGLLIHAIGEHVPLTEAKQS
jgi:hypothetical protein